MTDLRKTIGSLDNLIAFDAAARHQNFSRAAKELSVAQPAISRRIQQLEASLGTPLFARHGTRIQLTRAGEEFHSVVASAFHNIDQSSKALPRNDDGIVSLRVNVAAASLWLMPALGDFYERYPHIRLHLVCVDELPEFAGGGFDLEIRFGLGSWPGYESFPLLPEEIYPVASPSFLSAHRIEGVGDLAKVPLLQLANFTSPLMDWRTWLGPASQSDQPVIRPLTTYAMVIEAAIFGHGVALGWHEYVRRAIAKGDLVRLPVEARRSDYREFLVVKSGSKRFSVEQTKLWLLELAGRS